jgi:hypothetical protein
MGVAQPRIRVSLPEVRHNLCPKKKNNGPCVVVWRLMNSPSHSPLDGQKERRAASRGELWVLGPEHCANPVLATSTAHHAGDGQSNARPQFSRRSCSRGRKCDECCGGCRGSVEL